MRQIGYHEISGFFFSSVKELEKFLSAEFLENASLTDDAKADIIIAGKGYSNQNDWFF